MCEEKISFVREHYGEAEALAASQILKSERSLVVYDNDAFAQTVLWKHAVNKLDEKRPLLHISFPKAK